MTYTYRYLKTVDDLQQADALQALVWGSEPSAAIPMHLLHSLLMAGNPVIGAFDGERLVGLSIGFLGLADTTIQRPAMANLKLASKRLAVHPDYRSQGIGYILKKKQRQYAQYQSLQLITWTFDPLLSRNAYLNLHRLGAIIKTFHQDYYDGMPDFADSIGASDRMLCEWWVTSNRVEERLHGSRSDLMLAHYLEGNTPIINPSDLDPQSGLAIPQAGSFDFANHHMLLVEIPANLAPYEAHPAVLQAWRDHSRQVFRQVMGAGYVATDFLHETYEGWLRSFYLFSFDGEG